MTRKTDLEIGTVKMPRTKLGMQVAKRKKDYQSRVATRKKNIIESCPTPQWQHYRQLCDYLFETYIRYRDGWKCVLCGKQHRIGDYEHYHACHFISRRILSTRYDPINCHGQSSWLNYQERLGNVKVIDEYLTYVREKYGVEEVKRLYSLAKTHTVWNLSQWIQKARELYIQPSDQVPGWSQIIDGRLKALYNTTKKRFLLEQMLNSMGQ